MATELSAKYHLVQLAKEELKVQTKVDDFEMWGAPALTLEQYQRKEALQRATPFSQRGSVFWALVKKRASGDNGDSDADLAAAKGLIYAHCESHRFDCVLRKPNGELVRGFSHHIGSVFTLPSHRKQGLGSFFLAEIAKSMAVLPDAVGSTLYSDIGPTFYDRLGWRLYPSTMAELDVAAPHNQAATTASADAKDTFGTKLFLDQELDAFLVQDNRRIEAEVQGAKYAGQEVFAALATRDSVEWQFCIGAYYASIRGFTEIPTQCGLKIDDDAFIVWCYNIKESTLYILRARFPDDGRHEVVVGLLRAALVEAQKFKLKHVAIWDPQASLFATEVTSALDITKLERPDSLSSAMVFAQHRSSGDESKNASLPIWVANEKFAWV